MSDAADDADALEQELLVEPEPPWDAALEVFHAAGVRLEPGRVVDADAGDSSLRKGDVVVLERDGAPHAVVLAVVVVPSRRVLRKPPLPRVLRRATEEDLRLDAAPRIEEARVARAAREALDRLRLPFKVLRAELTDDARVVVWFAGDEKLPFLELLRELGPAAGDRRLELRQAGPRDASRRLGGVGPCGLQLCCNTFLADTPPVTLRMAKDQGLPTTPIRVNGVCGRLLCCLVYEEAHYRAMRETVPQVGDVVETVRGRAKVQVVDVLAMRVRVALEENGASLDVAIADLVRPSSTAT